MVPACSTSVAGGDAIPEVAEAAPAGDAVEVAEDLDAGKGVELVPGEGDLLSTRPVNSRRQWARSMRRRAAGIEDGPLAGAALAGRDALGAVGVRADDDVGRLVLGRAESVFLELLQLEDRTFSGLR